MKVSIRWLKEFVDFDIAVEELASRLTDAGLEVETITPVGRDLDRVVVGQIKRMSKHPQAEKLSVCEVAVGSESLQIVCGAPNVAEGANVPVALIGAKLPGGIQITENSLRGVESYGMICSEKELEVGEDEEGILILDADLKVGESISSALDLEDWILDIDLTPNRPDCLSVMGVAREVAALCGSRLKRREVSLHEIEEMAQNRVQVEIGDPQACPRYAARVIEDVKIVESPFWLRRKLQSGGMRPINNVVDITNLVMLELGHPLHGFDYKLFGQKKVVVRRAQDEEKFVTLDQVERTLSREALLITDGTKPVAIAGIMGGMESEVGPDTRTVLLESAYFDPKVIRRGRISLSISTESSQRFERGADPNGVVKAIDRAAELLENLASGKVLKGVVDSYPSPIHPVQITLRPQRVNKILSTDLQPQQIKSILSSLELSVKVENSVEGGENYDLEVEIPTLRPDLTREIDLVEEIARIHGYGNIKTTLRAGGNLVTEIGWEDEVSRRVKEFLVGRGLFEVITNNLVDPEVLAKLNPDILPVSIRNPLSQDLSVLSTTLAYNLLWVVSRNKNRLEKNLRIFELGKVFSAKGDRLPDERLHLGIAISGNREPRHWETEETETDLFDLKGILEGLFEHLLLSFELNPGGNAFLQADRCFHVQIGGEKIGLLGEVTEEILDAFEIKDKVFWAELDFEKLSTRVPRKKQFSSLPKFPPVDRDIAVVVDTMLLSKMIRDKIKEVGGGIVEEVTLFDVYKGKQVPAGKKSLAYFVRYRSQEKTLTDEEVDEIHRKVISELERSFDATLRR
ncbi:MAG: phenylalanine--tRNA ligase subunit beta [candidate division Zixibacteria bacterium]|nr:phenylalanine--tRNA ligase subunit beta [candidate division Zixibacteria bacterium]